MSLRRPWQIILVACAVLALVGVIGISRLPYFGVSGANVSPPLEAGQTLLIGVAGLEARAGDRIELRSVEVLGPHTGAISGHVERERADLNGIGAVFADSTISGVPARERLEPLADFAFTDADGHIGVVLEIPGIEPGTVEVQGVRVRYSVNGRWEQEELIEMSATVCVATPRPADCGAKDPES